MRRYQIHEICFFSRKKTKGGDARRIDLLSNQSTVMAFGGGRGIVPEGHRAKGNIPQSEVRNEKTKELTLGR